MTGKKRFHTIDTVRGFLLVNMIIYHLIWDIVWIFGVNWTWYTSSAANVWEKIGCSGFILLSGISWRISGNIKNKIKNGILVLASGELVAAASLLMPADDRIKCGVLTFLGSAMLIMIPLDKILKNVGNFVGLLVSGVLFSLFWGINEGTIVYGNVELPRQLYSGGLMTYLGFMSGDFYSADYFSLLPWIFMYICGYFLSPAVLSLGEKVLGIKAEPFAFMGRHSLIIYLLHQPLVYGVLYLIFKFI